MDKETLIIDPDAGDPVIDLLARNPELRFKRDIYLAACRDLNSNGVLFEPKDLPPQTTLFEMIAETPEHLREHVLKLYRCRAIRLISQSILRQPSRTAWTFRR